MPLLDAALVMGGAAALSCATVFCVRRAYARGRVPREKELYVSKNLTQSAVLAGLVPAGVSVMAQGIRDGAWDGGKIVFCSTAYAATDLAALFFMPRELDLSTVAHHLAVTAWATAIVSCGGEVGGSALRAVVGFATWSAIAGCVNFYLGFRWTRPRGDQGVRKLARFCAIVYAATILYNAPTQLWLLGTSPLSPLTSPATVLWALTVPILLYDDYKLMVNLAKTGWAWGDGKEE